MTAPGTPHAKTRGRQRRIRTSDIVLVMLLLGVVALFYNFSLQGIFELLYRPVAGLILLIVILEFLWLKSGDRTRLYRLEIERLRTRRYQDEELLRRARAVIDQAVKGPETEEAGRAGDWRQRALDTVKDMDERL